MGAGLLLRALGIQGLSGGAMAVLCLFPTLCDLALAALLWRLALPRAGERAALAAAAAAAFNPAFLFDCAVWKQVDAALALALVLCFLLLSRGHWYAAALAYAAALLIKPQALLFGPPFALGYLLALPAHPLCGRRESCWTVCSPPRPSASGRCCWSAPPSPAARPRCSGWCASTSRRDLLPLRLGQRLQPHRAAGRQLAGRERPLSAAALEGLGHPFHPAADRGPRAGALRGRRRGKADLLLLAAFYGSGIFLFAHRMHERYLFPALALLLAAWARSGDRRLRWPALLFSLSLLTNMAVVYLSAERDTFLEGEGVRLVMRIAAIAALAGFALLARACRQICSGQPAPEPAGGRHRPDLSSLARRLLPAPPDPIPRWSRRDTLAVLLLTLFAGCISLPYLGTRSVPQTGCTGPLEAEITLPADAAVDSVWIYPGISEGTLTLTDGDGQTVCSFSLSVGSCFSWQRQEVLTDAGSFTLTLTGGTVNELVLVDREGRAIPPASVTPAGGANALFDEADTLPERPSQLNGMYFDEIYHGRTGFETLHGLPIYETTHPPLGKDLIAVGIALFGMNPFGWRIMGALFGVAMVPVFYLLARGSSAGAALRRADLPLRGRFHAVYPVPDRHHRRLCRLFHPAQRRVSGLVLPPLSRPRAAWRAPARRAGRRLLRPRLRLQVDRPLCRRGLCRGLLPRDGAALAQPERRAGPGRGAAGSAVCPLGRCALLCRGAAGDLHRLLSADPAGQRGGVLAVRDLAGAALDVPLPQPAHRHPSV